MNEAEVMAGIAKRVLRHIDAGTTDSAEEPYRLPTWIYTDPALFAREREEIFKKNPQLVCFSTDLPKPGSFLTFDDLGVPVLLTRDQDGKVQAFLNTCTHRSARLKDGSGVSASLSCPYHGWSFDLKGKLRTVYKEETFGAIDKSYYHLTKLPVEEKYGMVYVGLDPDLRFSIDEHLGDLAPFFAMWNLGEAQLIDTHEFRMKTNWKLALDTFCEGYHFAILHKKSVGDYALGNISLYDRFGPELRHHRMTFPNSSITRLKDIPEAEWGTGIGTDFQLVHFLYPNISLLVSPSAVELFQLYPGETPGEHVTRYRSYWRDMSKADQGRGPQDHFEFIRDVVADEDYWVSGNVQTSLNANIRPFNTLGRNEPALINMHKAFLRGVGMVPEEAPLSKVGAD